MAKRSTYPIKRKKKIIITLSVISLLAVVGSVTGTYAWFEYEARAGLNFKGTTVGKTDELLIGFVSKEKIEGIPGLKQDESNPNIYWSSDGLDSNLLLYYSELNGFAGKNLSPVTSGAFHKGESLSLTGAPAYLDNSGMNGPANKQNYFSLQLVFKHSMSSGKRGIILSDVDVSGKGEVKDALRIHFDSNEDKFIYSPTSENNGATPVGGILDLNLDGYYDVGSDNKEYVYGQGENIIYHNHQSEDEEPIKEELRDTFNGAHKNGTYGVDLANSTFKGAEYIGNKDVLFDKLLASTDEKDGLIHLNMTVYLEGWSRAMNQLEHKNYFSMELQFETVDL